MSNFLKLPSNLTVDMVIEAVERSHTNCDNPGFCLACGAEHFECEPDARNYTCEECDAKMVFGAEEILMGLDLSKPIAIKPQPRVTTPTTTNKTFLKAIEEVRALGFTEPSAPQTRTNPYSGLTHILDPLAVMLFDFITTRKLDCEKDYKRTTWDNARYAFNEMWPTAYYDLLD